MSRLKVIMPYYFPSQYAAVNGNGITLNRIMT